MPTPEQPSPLDFDLGSTESTPAVRPIARDNLFPDPSQPLQRPSPIFAFFHRLKAKGGFVGAVASALIVIAKFLGPIKLILLLIVKVPLLVTLGSMALSIWLQALRFGWPLAFGIVGMILIHECGHALAAKRLGHRTNGMIFVPFMGAAVFTRGGGTSVTEDAFVGIMGPIFGTAVGCIYWALFFATKSPIFLQLAAWTFAINLFNLLPTPPLDGGWIAPVFSPKLLAIGMVLLVFVGFHNWLILLLAVASLPRVLAGWKARPETSSYFQATSRDRVTYAGLYIGLAGFLALTQLAASTQLAAVTVRQIL